MVIHLRIRNANGSICIQTQKTNMEQMNSFEFVVLSLW